MNMQPLLRLLFNEQTSTDDSLTADIGKDVSTAITTAVEPLNKKLSQVEKDVNVIQKAAGERPQTPTNSRSTKGTTTPVSPTPSKNAGTITPSGTTGSEGDGSKNKQTTTDTTDDTIQQMQNQVQYLVKAQEKEDRKKREEGAPIIGEGVMMTELFPNFQKK